ncbi:hypothetical protein EC988_003383, partial [Linderina pennispora]
QLPCPLAMPMDQRLPLLQVVMVNRRLPRPMTTTISQLPPPLAMTMDHRLSFLWP